MNTLVTSLCFSSSHIKTEEDPKTLTEEDARKVL